MYNRARSHFKTRVGGVRRWRGVRRRIDAHLLRNGRLHVCRKPFQGRSGQAVTSEGVQTGGRALATVRSRRLRARPLQCPAHNYDPCAQVHRERGDGTCRARGPAEWYHRMPPHSGRETESVRIHTNTHTHTPTATAAARKWQRLRERVRALGKWRPCARS